MFADEIRRAIEGREPNRPATGHGAAVARFRGRTHHRGRGRAPLRLDRGAHADREGGSFRAAPEPGRTSVDRGWRYPSGSPRKLQAVGGLTAAHGCLDGASPPLGGLRAAATGSGCAVHPGRAGGTGAGGGRDHAPGRLPPRRRPPRGDRRRVAETTVRNAIREAGKLGLVTVEERRITGFRNDTNIVRIVAPEWTAWLRLARKTHPAHLPQQAAVAEGGGCKSAKRTHTQVSKPVRFEDNPGVKRLPEGSGRPRSCDTFENPAGWWEGQSHALRV